MISRRRFIELASSAATASILPAAGPASITPDQVHHELVAGNHRFVSGHPRHPHSSLAWARRTGKLGQHPHAVVLCCSDSRVVPEIIFDQGLGDLFTVRVAGNTANDDEIASIEYAVEHLSVPLCAVIGHTGCGAVTAVVEGNGLPPEIEHLVAPIRIAHKKTKSRHPGLAGKQLIRATVYENVVETVHMIVGGPKLFHERIGAGRLRVEGGVYDLETGRIDWIHRSRLQ